MVSLTDLKDLVLYKKQFYLPINEKDKKHGSAITLLTPNFRSSKLAMTAPYMINHRYFESYYIEKEITRFINHESVIPMEDRGEYIFEEALNTEIRNNLPDSDFGIPQIRKYPINDEKHVILAIRFFNHVESKYEKELAENIIKKIKEFKMADQVNVGDTNRFNKYWNKVKSSFTNESSIISESNIRKNVVEKIKNELEKENLKAHISKNGEWGYNKFVDDKTSSTICLGSFKPENYEKAYQIIKKNLPENFKVTKDSYNTIFIDDKKAPTVQEATMYLNEVNNFINPNAVKHVDNKFKPKPGFVKFSGYKSDIDKVKKYINDDTVSNAFYRINKHPFGDVIINVCSDSDQLPEFTKDSVLVYTPNAIKKAGFTISYDTYIRYIIQLYVVYTLAPNPLTNKIMDSIAEPAAIYLSGIADKKLYTINHNDYLVIESIMQNIEKTEGIDYLVKVISSNNAYSILKRYGNVMKESNDFSFIREETDFLNEENEDNDAPSNITINDPVPQSIKNMQNMATKLKRSIRRQSIYKLNKIRRDMERGNVGTEKHEIKSLELLKSGLPTNNMVSSSSKSGTTSTEESCIPLSKLNNLTNGDYVTEGNVVYLFEDKNSVYDSYLRKSLYKDRIRNNRQILEMYSKVKSELPFIKFTYINLLRYSNRNIFLDLSYYNEAFFRNTELLNDEDRKNPFRFFRMYIELLERLFKGYSTQGYNKKTIFIPVLDWSHNNSTKMWMFREDINPISVIYYFIKNKPARLKELFGDSDVVFLGGKNYFKINFSNTSLNTTDANKFILLINRIIKLGYNSPADPDPDGELDTSPKGIAMDIINKVEKSQNVDINDVSKISTLKTSIDLYNSQIAYNPNAHLSKAVRKDALDISPNLVPNEPTKVITGNITATDYSKSKTGTKVTRPIEVDKKIVTKAENKAAIGQSDETKSVNKTTEEDKKNAIVDKIVKAAEESDSVDDAMDKLNNDEFKEMIIALQNDSTENVRVDKAKASAVIKAQDEFHKKQVQGRSVQDMLNHIVTSDDIPASKLPVASINNDWNNMTFVNFDKDYDFNADIMKMLDTMKNWTFPIAVTNIDIKDNSTSEDILDLWTIDCLDYNKRKFTIKIDIPKFINGSNFLKLRGNEKTLMIQSIQIPIIKTGSDECQIIGSGGYNKTFVYRFGDRKGQSMASSARLIKALIKYCEKNNDIVIEEGDSTKICAKYELPIDYIDLSKVFNSITLKDMKIYFNQDELRSKYEVDDSKGIPIGVINYYNNESKKGEENIIYYTGNGMVDSSVSSFIAKQIGIKNESFAQFYDKIPNSNSKSTYSRAKILNHMVPIVLICAYLEGLITTMRKAGIKYQFVQKLEKGIKYDDNFDYIRFSDGYLIYNVTYASSLLMNGLKENDTESYSIKDINNRKMYIDFLDSFAGNLDTDGLENAYDCMIDPITKEILEKFNLPTDYVSVMIYASGLLADNKYVRHIDQAGRRWRRKELIAGYFYKVLTGAYQKYANSNRRTRKVSRLDIKQSSLIDLIVSKDPATSDLSVNNALNDVECANTVTNKGLVGMNVPRGYTIATRGYDDSMLNLLGMDTGFSGNVGINRQATINANIEGGRGFVKTIGNDVSKMTAASAFTMTEAVTPLGSTHDDTPRTLMTYVQTSKHMIRCDNNDPTLVTTGADEAMPYMVSDIFAFKAKKDGKIIELVQEGFGKKNYMILEYKDGTHEFVNLSEEVKKNSDGGYFVPMKLDTDMRLGQSFKSGTIIAYDKLSFAKSLGESGNLAATIGTLAKVAIINTDEGFEDSAAITQSFAEKLGTDVIQGIETKVDKGSNIFINKKIGDSVMEGDILFSFQNDFGDDVVNSLLKNLTNDSDVIDDLSKKPVRSKYTGIVSDIVIYRTCDDDSMSPSLKKFVSQYENNVKSIKNIYKQYGIDGSALPQIGKVPEVGRTKHLDDAVLIVYYIKYNDKMSIGDKIVFYSANKGIIKYIIPKEDEPYTDFRPNEHVDSFMSLSSISGRMTCSIPLFAATSKLMVELDRSVKDIAGIPYDESKL